MKFNPKQVWSIAKSNSRINIWEGSVRSGKTVGINHRLLTAIGEDRVGVPADAIDIMVGKTLGSLKRNVINPMIEMLGTQAARYYPGKQEFHIWGQPIHVFGVNDDRSVGKIQGTTVRKAYGDEVVLWPESFFKMMDSRLSTSRSQFFGTTNPGPPKHYLKIEYLDRKSELDLSSFHFKLDDNLALEESYKEALKRNYSSGLWYRRFILGEWCAAEGAVYDCFEHSKHVLKTLPKRTGKVRKYIGVDYGTSNPTVFILFGVNYEQKPYIWAEKEYYYDSKKHFKQKSDEEYAEDFVKFAEGETIEAVIVDPSAASFKLALQRKKYFVVKNADNDVLLGIRNHTRVLSNGVYKIHSACENTISEYGAYMWDKHALIKGVDQPAKEFDHCKDCERYVTYLLEGKNLGEYEKFVRD